MFGLSFGELLIVTTVALLVLGPSGLPKLAQGLGKTIRDIRQASSGLREALTQELDIPVERPNRGRLATRDRITPVPEPQPSARSVARSPVPPMPDPETGSDGLIPHPIAPERVSEATYQPPATSPRIAHSGSTPGKKIEATSCHEGHAQNLNGHLENS